MSGEEPNFQRWAIEVRDGDGNTRIEEVVATNAVRARRQVLEPGITVLKITPMGQDRDGDLVSAARSLLLKVIRTRRVQFRGALNEEERALFDALTDLGKAPPLAGGNIGRPHG